MRFFILIVMMILWFGCTDLTRVVDNEVVNDLENNTPESNDQENDDDYAKDDSDFIPDIPKCADQWEKLDMEENADMFDFKLKKTTGLWSWKEDGDMEILDYEGDIIPIHISDDGSLIAIESTETSAGYAFLVYFKPDGSFEKYVLEFEKGETFCSGSTLSKKHLIADAVYDNRTGKINVVVNIRNRKGSIAPFIININNNREVTYRFWKTVDNSICKAELNGDLLVLLCENWKDSDSEPENIERALDLYSCFNDVIFKKTYSFEGGVFLQSHYSSNGEVYVDTFNQDLFVIDSEMCVETKNQRDFFLSDYYLLKKSLEASYIFPVRDFNYASGAFQQYIFFDDSFTSVSGDFSYFNYGDREILFSLSPKNPQEQGQLFYNFIFGGFSEIIDGKLFKTGAATTDLEGKNRQWNDEKCDGRKPYLEYIDPETKEVYVRHFIKENKDCYSGKIFITDSRIFYLTTYARDDDGDITAERLYRMKKDWLICDDFKAKDEFLGIEEKTLEREKMKAVNSVSSGGMHTCSINSDNFLFCWGDNTKEQQGEVWGSIDKEEPTRITNNFPGPVDRATLLKGKKIISLSSGYQHSCAVDDTGEVYCWGNNTFDQLGNGSFSGTYAPILAAVEGEMKEKKIVKVAAGQNSSCALDSEGEVYCWGQNFLGQLGDGTNDRYRNDPRRIEMDGILKEKDIIDVFAGGKHVCALDSEGEVYCWGDNDDGQLGDGTGNNPIPSVMDISKVPVKVVWNDAVPEIVKVAGGTSHTCAIDKDGLTYCWGVNSKGQLGDGTTETRNVPVRVKTAFVFKDISAGFEHTCGVENNGDVYCWGSNITDQLGNNSENDSYEPVKVSFTEDVKIESVSCGHRHTCAVDVAGNTWCWGWNQDGQLGNRSYEDSSAPVRVE